MKNLTEIAPQAAIAGVLLLAQVILPMALDLIASTALFGLGAAAGMRWAKREA